jgi:two-component system response regulator FixJ
MRGSGASISFENTVAGGLIHINVAARLQQKLAGAEQGQGTRARNRDDPVMIFILDDDEAIRDSLQILLECEGLAARTFACGRQFLDTVRPQAGDCLLLDLYMPVIGGLDILEALRQRGDDVPVIVLTGHPSPAAESRATAAGAFAFIEKPYRADALLNLIRQALRPPEVAP